MYCCQNLLRAPLEYIQNIVHTIKQIEPEKYQSNVFDRFLLKYILSEKEKKQNPRAFVGRTNKSVATIDPKTKSAILK